MYGAVARSLRDAIAKGNTRVASVWFVGSVYRFRLVLDFVWFKCLIFLLVCTFIDGS